MRSGRRTGALGRPLAPVAVRRTRVHVDLACERSSPAAAARPRAPACARDGESRTRLRAQHAPGARAHLYPRRRRRSPARSVGGHVEGVMGVRPLFANEAAVAPEVVYPRGDRLGQMLAATSMMPLALAVA